MSEQTEKTDGSTDQEKPETTEYIAISDRHGWCRNDSETLAVLGALSHSSTSEGDEVTVKVYECEPGAIVDNMGRIGVPEENEKSEVQEEYLRGSDPLDPIVKMTFKKKPRQEKHGNEWATLDALDYVILKRNYEWSDE